jgi:hypothetical protein
MQYGGRVARQTLAVVAVLCTLLGNYASAAAAGSASNLTTSPISTDLAISPGHSATTTLQVENNSASAVQVAIELRTFKATGTTGQAAITTPPPGDDSLSYVHFSQTTFTAQPGVFTPVQMTVSLPATAALGYYYAVLFKPVLPTTSAHRTNTVTLSNAILILVDSGSANEKRQLDVTSFTASKKFYQYLPATFNITVHNSGSIFLPPAGNIYISRSSAATGHIMATLSLNTSGGRVLPDSSRTFSATWNDGFPVYQTETASGQPVFNKKDQPIEQLHWNFADTNHFRFGKYYARLTLVYDNGQRDVPIYGVVSFWVIPWKLILLALLVIAVPIILLLLALRYRRLYRRHIKDTTPASKPKED